MARTGDAGNGLDPQNVRYNARALASDPAAQYYDISTYTMQQIQDYLNSETIDTALGLAGEQWDGTSILGGLNIPRANNPNPTTGIFAEQKSIWGATDYERDLKPFGLRNWAEQYYNPSSVNTIDPNNYNANLRMEGNLAASALSDIPTSSSDYSRPRTVAAGYDYDEESDTGTITVVFRDGTFWNYYAVPSSVWIKFHHEFSKGPMLNRKSSKQSMDGDLLSYENGPADLSKLSDKARETIYKAARTVQIYNRTKYVAGAKGVKGGNKVIHGTPQNARAKRGFNPHKAYNNRTNGKNPNQK